ncbi:MAG: histidinol-phosphate transaminase [Gammaproteobacteria bacterium]|nr:histidinol-phosphate transaminase [Gammaproteobacteria bacterium]
MSKYWSPLVSRLAPYVPGEQPQDQQYIKLNTNENPYGPSPMALQAIADASGDALRRYPDPESVALKQALADYHGQGVENLFVGNGSDEVLALAFMAFFMGDKPLLYPDISYSFYPVYAELYGIEVGTIPLAEDFSITVDDYFIDNGGIIFPNPNAPTGMLLALGEIERLLQQNTESVVIVDEAYIDFGGQSAIELVSQYDNLLVIRTYSKSRSLAGIRLGYAVGSAVLIDGLLRVKNSFNSYPIDRLTQAVGIASLQDEAYFQQHCEQIIETREWTEQQLRGLGFDVLPSAANFVFAQHNEYAGEVLYQGLKDKGVLVRHFMKPRIGERLRITIGTPEEMAVLISTLKEIAG